MLFIVLLLICRILLGLDEIVKLYGSQVTADSI
jgi:hypothetical protein